MDEYYIPGAYFYPDEEIYPNKRIPERNNGKKKKKMDLTNEILHEKMVDEQYEKGWTMMNCLAMD